MRKKNKRANNALAVLGNISAKQFEDISKAGTKRPVQRGRAYQGNGSLHILTSDVIANRIDDPFTILITIKTTSLQSAFAGIYSYSVLTNGSFQIDYDGSGNYRIGLRNGSGVDTNIIIGASTGDYDTIAVKYQSNGLVKTFINGAAGGTATVSNFLGQVTTGDYERKILGNRIANVNSSSLLCEVVELNRELTDEQILNYRIGDYLNNKRYHFKCDEGSGAVAYDSSGNGNDGAIMDAITTPSGTTNSIHQWQDVFSWQNIVGYSLPENLIANSENFNNTPWARSQCTVTEDASIAPDGAMTADLCTTTAALNPLIQISTNYAVGDVFNYSVYAKAGTVDHLYMFAFRYSVAGGFPTFDLTNGTVVGGSGTIEDVGNGWYRCSAVFTVIQAGQQFYLRWSDSVAGAGSAEGDTINLWGAQGTRGADLIGYYPNRASNITFDGAVFLPRDESQVLPPFVDVMGNPLQFIGEVPKNFDFVNSACYMGNGAGFYRLAENNYATLANFEFSFWIQPLTNDGTLLNCIPVAKYNFGSTSAFQVNRVASNGPIRYAGGDSAGNSFTVDIISNQQLITRTNQVLKGTVKIFGNTLQTFLDDVLQNTQTLVSGIRLFDVPFTIGATNQTATPLPNSYNFLQFELKELDASGNDVQTLSFINFDQPIQDAINQTAYSKTGNNHATLIDGSTANEGEQSEFHDLMHNGFSIYSRMNDATSGQQDLYQVDKEVMLDFSAPFSIKIERGLLSESRFYIQHGFAQADNALSSMNLILSKDRNGRTSTENFAARITFGSALNQQLDLGFDLGNTDLWNEMIINYLGGDRTLASSWSITIDSSAGAVTAATGAPVTHLESLEGFFATTNIVFGMVGWEKISVNDEIVATNAESSAAKFFVPKHATNNTDALANPLSHPQDGKTFLQCETELQAPRAPELVSNDDENIFFLSDGTPLARSWGFLHLNQFNNNKYFIGNEEASAGRLTPLAYHKGALVRAQLDTEKRVREAVEPGNEVGESLIAEVNAPSQVLLLDANPNAPVYRVDGRVFTFADRDYTIEESSPFQGIGGFRMIIEQLSRITSFNIQGGFTGKLDISKLTGLTSINIQATDLVELVLPKNLTVGATTINSNDRLIAVDISTYTYTSTVCQARFNDLLEEILLPIISQPTVLTVDLIRNSLKRVDLRGFTHATNINVSNNNLEQVILPNNNAAVALTLSNNVELTGTLDLSVMPNIRSTLNLSGCRLNSIVFPPDSDITAVVLDSNRFTSLDFRNLVRCTSFQCRFISTLTQLQFPVSTAAVRNINFDNAANIAGAFDLSGFSDLAGVLNIEENAGITSVVLPSQNIGPFTNFQLRLANAVWNGDFTTVQIDGAMTVRLNSVTEFTFNATNKNCRLGLGVFGYVLNETTIFDMTGMPDLGVGVSFENSRFRNYIFPQNTPSSITNFTARNNPAFQGTLDLSNLVNLSRSITASNNIGMTGLIMPTNSNTFTVINIANSRCGYIDFTVTPNALDVNNASWNLSNNAMNAEEVNHILVDLDNISDGNFTGRLIVISGNNAAPDSTSGGFDGLAAVTSLRAKGFTVTHTL